MTRNKRMIGILTMMFMILSMFPVRVQADILKNDAVRSSLDDVEIISTTTVTVKEVQEWARKRNATETFINLAPIFEKYSKVRGGVNWLVAYVQAAKETGYGRFGGVLDESYHNTCGLKNSSGGNDTDPNAHKKFDNWDQGVIAHLDHLALYAGADNYPKTHYEDKWKGSNLADNQTYDPRHIGWFSTELFGKAKTVTALDRWATGTNYGKRLLDLYKSAIKESSNKPNEGDNSQGGDSVKLPSIGRIDEPSEGFEVSQNTLKVRGWAVNSSGVKEVKILVDGKLKATTKTSLDRPDVANVYPQYPNAGKSGFKVDVNISDIENGSRKIVAQVVGNDSSIYNIEKNINVNKIVVADSKGRIDDPSEGIEVTGNNLKVRGWAVNSSGVKEVKILVDGKEKATTKTNLDRPDVANVYPQYPNAGKSGFQVDVDINDIENGSKKIVAQVVGNDGSIHTMDTNVNINKELLKPVGRIDEPSDNLEVNGNRLKVRGWAATSQGIKEIKVLANGVFLCNAKIGLSRPDVHSAYPQYPESYKSGFEYEINISNLKGGENNIQVEVISNDNSKYSLSRKVIIFKGESKDTLGRIDETSLKENTLKVRGWVINSSGVKEVKAFINGEYKGIIQYGKYRPDVNGAYPGYPSGNYSGYEGYVNVGNTFGKTIEVKLEVLSNDYTTKVFIVTVNKNEGKLIVLDPGHNLSWDRGAVATHNGITYIEGELNMQISLKLKEQLEKREFRVILTRQPGEYPTITETRPNLQQRVDIANENNADLFISIHQNSFSSSYAKGVEAYYSTAIPGTRGFLLTNHKEMSKSTFDMNSEDYKIMKSRKLAANIAADLASELGQVNRGAKDEDFYVIKHTTMPSILVECGFITNKEEAQKIANDANQQKIAQIIAEDVAQQF